jgi:hypothetical protein
MTESTRKKLVYAFAALSLTWAAFNYPTTKKRPSAVPKSVERDSLSDSSGYEQPSMAIDLEVQRAREWGSDPFRGPAKQVRQHSAKSERHWQVSGILVNGEVPMAYINGRAATVGDVVDGAEVISIEQKQVTLEYGGKQLVLTVSKG